MIGLMVSQYRILEEIGRGAMGIVFKAQDTIHGRLVALKIVAEKLVDDPEMLLRFEREGVAASALNHPNICTVIETGNWRGRPYLALELLTGQALDERLKAGPVPVEQAIGIGIAVTGALEAAHAIGVIHRDIKPANLFLTGSGQVKVLDFGLAKVKLPSVPIGEDAATVAMMVTRQGIILGSLAYMSPEQFCREPLDGRADLYSLGITLYELATGHRPVGGSPDLPGLPAGFGSVVAKLMSRDARLRYQTAGEARQALEGCAGKAAAASGPAGWLSKAFRGG